MWIMGVVCATVRYEMTAAMTDMKEGGKRTIWAVRRTKEEERISQLGIARLHARNRCLSCSVPRYIYPI